MAVYVVPDEPAPTPTPPVNANPGQSPWTTTPTTYTVYEEVPQADGTIKYRKYLGCRPTGISIESPSITIDAQGNKLVV
jgi:hypothetical protein